MKQGLIRWFLGVGLIALPLPAVLADSHELPPVPFEFGLGHSNFNQHCAACHGKALEGSDNGPPLMHGYYNPSHHSDTAFYRAMIRGVPQHHWNFGDMPPVPGIKTNEAEAVVRFIRWAQKAMGLY